MSESFAELFGKSTTTFKEGEVVKGTILAVDQDHVTIDVGFKSEGLVAAWEFMDEDGTLLVKAGDTVATIEAMKMEASITAPVAGPISRIAIDSVSQLEGGDLVAVIDA